MILHYVNWNYVQVEGLWYPVRPWLSPQPSRFLVFLIGAHLPGHGSGERIKVFMIKDGNQDPRASDQTYNHYNEDQFQYIEHYDYPSYDYPQECPTDESRNEYPTESFQYPYENGL